jgi:hypothetical protein
MFKVRLKTCQSSFQILDDRMYISSHLSSSYSVCANYYTILRGSTISRKTIFRLGSLLVDFRKNDDTVVGFAPAAFPEHPRRLLMHDPRTRSAHGPNR